MRVDVRLDAGVHRSTSAVEPPRGGEEPGVADHAVVGADRARLDVPGAAHDLLRLGQAEGRVLVVERLAQQRRLVDRRAGRPAGSRRGAAPSRPPATTLWGSGMSSRIRSRSGLVDALGHVADLDPVGRVGPQRRRHVGLGPLGEVLAQLVARRRRPRPAARSSRGRPSPTPASSTRWPGRDVGRDEDGAEVLRVDDLGAPGHLQHDVAQGGPQHQEARPVEPVTVHPSVAPMMSSWASTPAWVWKVAPATSVSR